MMPSVARVSRTRAVAAATTGTKAVATTTTTRVPTAQPQARQHCRGYPAPCEGELEEDLRRLQRLAERKVPVASGRQPHHRAVLPTQASTQGYPEPPHPHDKKGKKKNDKGNGDFQEPDKAVNVLFGGLPSRREQKATRREVMSIEPAVPTLLGGRRYPLPSPAWINGQASLNQDGSH
jgi:hypothetical protein